MGRMGYRAYKILIRRPDWKSPLETGAQMGS